MRAPAGDTHDRGAPTPFPRSACRLPQLLTGFVRKADPGTQIRLGLPIVGQQRGLRGEGVLPAHAGTVPD